MKHDLIQKGIDADRITVMHYPVDPDDQKRTRMPADVRAEFGVDADDAGHRHVRPSVDEEGLPRTGPRRRARAQPRPERPVLVLRRRPAARRAGAANRAAGIADRVRLFGFRRDVPDLMRAIDVMCLPSHREPFGLVYVEAALAEKPVIACEAGGAPEIIEHGETGLLVRPQNVPDLAQAILTLLDNRDHAAAMGRRGRELALDRFTWPNYLARISASVYDRVLGRERSALAADEKQRNRRMLR